MQQIEITPRQRLVLRVAEFHYHDGVDAIASAAKLKPHAVRYDLKELTDRGIIEPCVFFNECCFGYYIFHVHISAQLQHLPCLERSFKQNSRVVYLGRQSGERALGVTVLSKRPEDLFSTIDRVGEQARVPFAQVGWCIEGEFYHYGASCVFHEPPHQYESVQTWQGDRVEIDHVDARIMQMMKRKRLLGVAEIARATGMAASTVQYRLKRLNESGALLRRSLLVNYSALGFSMFEILVRCLGPAADVTKILRAFCKTSPGVKVLIRCFGDWDFKVSFCAKTLGEVLVFEESLQRALGAGLASSVIVPVRGAVKTGDFPAEDFKSDG